jgi:hypothetical protein
MPMQPQKPPTGRAMSLALALARTVERENKKTGGRLTVNHVLRALEWTRYSVTEAAIKVSGDAPAPKV